MPEYLAPGVYVEEFEMGAKPIEGVGTSTVGFLGMTERGPLKPRLVTSFAQFNRLYGGYIENSFTAYAVEGFFTNGGQRCFIGRVVKGGAVATRSMNDLQVEAIGEGEWGNNVFVKIVKATSGEEDLFNLEVVYLSPKTEIPENLTEKILEEASLVEVFDNLSTKKNDPDHFLKRVNDISTLIKIGPDDSNAGRPVNTDDYTRLENGNDGEENLTATDMTGSDTFGAKTGLNAFVEVDEIAILCAPDSHLIEGEDGKKDFFSRMLAHCEKLKDRFAILDVPKGQAGIEDLNLTSGPLRTSKYGAVYYPWIKVNDPLNGRKKLLPPGGYIAGIYARSDQERGVHKAPANEQVRGALELEFQISKGEQDILNPRHINCIRKFPGRGILVWGARTMIRDSLWKYINVRRLFIYIEESIEEGTQWVVFEPNDERLWGRIRATITGFLTTVWRDGALMGTTPDEAFFVRCDRSTMTQDDLDNGKLICVIGIAPVKPAEFVIFRIAQWASGSSITE